MEDSGKTHNTSNNSEQKSEKYSPKKIIIICSLLMVVCAFQSFVGFAVGGKIKGIAFAGLFVFFLIYLLNTIRKK